MANWREVLKEPKIAATKEYVKLNLRPEAEMAQIGGYALELCHDDEAEAALLLRKTTFSLFGRTWGDSLTVGDEGHPLLSVEEVIYRMAMLYTMTSEDWQRAVVYRTEREITEHPYELPYYLGMVVDLVGGAGLAQLEGGRGEFSNEVKKVADQVYQEAVGLSYYEMDKEVLARMMLRTMAWWKKEMEDFESVPERLRGVVAAILAEARHRLRELAVVLLDRGLVSKGEVVNVKGVGLFHYGDLIGFVN